jgi:N-acetylglucosaminyl-diphospho-decaprenol L-rhamnosyltransferase
MNAADVPPTLSVVVLSWNTQALTLACLRALAAEAPRHAREVIVVDNGSHDGSATAIAAEFPQVRLLRNQQNVGYAAGNNQGAAVARGTFVCLLNSDTEVREGALDRCVDWLVEHSDYGAVAPRLSNTDGSVQRACMRFPGIAVALCFDTMFGKVWPGSRVEARYMMRDFDHLTSRDVDQPPGACFVVRRDEYAAGGGLDPELFLFFNDVDLCRRMWNAGRRIRYLAEAEGVDEGVPPVRRRLAPQSARVLPQAPRPRRLPVRPRDGALARRRGVVPARPAASRSGRTSRRACAPSLGDPGDPRTVKVALACTNFPPEFVGGTERVVHALAQALRRLGDDVVVVTGSEVAHGGRDVEVEQIDGIEVRRIRRHAHESYGLDLRRGRVTTVVEDVLIAERVDVLHVHHWATLGIRLLRSARALRVVPIATLHDLWTSCGRFFRRPPPGITCPTGAGRDACVPCAAIDLRASPADLTRGIRYRDTEIALELAAAAAVTAPSHDCAAAAAEFVPFAGPITVVPHGLLEAPERRSTATPGTLRIGTFGNHVADKGLNVLVEAIAGLGVPLHVHGRWLDTSYATRVRARAAELGVEIVDHGPYAAGAAHPAESLDLAVFPSRCRETYGLVVEESLSRGVPVVVSDAGALGERIGEAGVVVRSGDVGELRVVLHRAVTDADFVDRLRRSLPESFATIDDAARAYRALYEAGR